MQEKLQSLTVGEAVSVFFHNAPQIYDTATALISTISSGKPTDPGFFTQVAADLGLIIFYLTNNLN